MQHPTSVPPLLLACLTGFVFTACLPEGSTNPTPRADDGAGGSGGAGAGADGSGAGGQTGDGGAAGDAGGSRGDGAGGDGAGGAGAGGAGGQPPVIVTRPDDCGDGATGRAGPEGGELVLGEAAGALTDAAARFPAGALDGDVEVELDCDADLVADGYVALGPALSVRAGDVINLGQSARVTLVFSGDAPPDGLRSDHIRLFWKPLDAGYVAEPPALNAEVDLYGGTFTFDTPALGSFQLGYAEGAGTPVEVTWTYRAITGISMGAGAASYIGLKYHDQFDHIAALGGSTDWIYTLQYVRNRLLGGFCTAEEGEIGTWCGLGPPTQRFEHDVDFLRWYYDPSEGNGGTFDRDEYVQLMQDLTYAYGNPFFYNEESPYTPPGVPISELRRPKGDRCAAECRGDDCPEPETFTIESGFYDDEYNPDGSLPVISFCDGEDGDPKGIYDPTREHDEPLDIALAVDVNGNGRRDEHEPVLRNSWEPYADLGCDGAASPDEPGYDAATNPDPAGDDYDWYRNPTGTEGNWLYDDCGDTAEPYDDFGLDGVPDTPQQADGGYDWGEGNGRFDYNPHYARFLERTPANIWPTLPEEAKARMKIWIDGGIRDVFNFAVAGAHAAGRLQAAGENVRIYDDFPAILPTADPLYFPELERTDPFGARGRHVLLRYGDPDATQFDIDLGDGAHVGTVSQALNRFMTMFDWVHHRWPKPDMEPILPPFEREDTIVFFDSPRFGKQYRFGISLPPGYGREDQQDKRYPVILLLHGYGQAPEDLPVTGAILAGQMAKGAWPKSIILFPEGFCGDADVHQCGDGVDNDGDGFVDSVSASSTRRECENNAGCIGNATCRNGWCCPPDWPDCGPPDPECERRSNRSEEGGRLARCADGVDNDLDGLTDLDDEGCIGEPDHDEEADCRQGSFYTTHIARKDGEVGGPDWEAAILDMLDYVDANYRTRAPETLTIIP